MKIPKILHTVWVGDRPAPVEWIDSWKRLNPEWRHILWDNEAVFGRQWRNQDLVDFFAHRRQWPAVADVIRYEYLHEQGGFAPGADSVCLAPIDELFTDDLFDAYTCYENEKVTGELVSPLLACTAGNELADRLIKILALKDDLNGDPWKVTGNLFMMHVIGALGYRRLKIWPSHFLLPEHHTGEKYTGDGKIYATHMWGTGKDAYSKLNQ